MPVGIVAVHSDDLFDFSRAADVFEVHDDVHRPHDGVLLRVLGDAGRHVLETQERVHRRVAVDGAASAGMPREPRFEKVERFASAHLADHDAVGGHAEHLMKAVRHGERAGRTHLHLVFRRALELWGILDDDYAVIVLGDFRENGVEERGFAALRAAGRHDVLLFLDGRRDDVLLVLRHDALFDVVIEGEDGLGVLADVERRLRNDVRQISLETAFREIRVRGDIGIEAGFRHVHDLVRERRDVQDDVLPLGRGQHDLRQRAPFAEAVYTDIAIFIAINLEYPLVLEKRHNLAHAGKEGREGDAVAVVMFLRHRDVPF